MTRLSARQWEVPGISVESTGVIDHTLGWPHRRDFVGSVGGENFQINLGWFEGAPFLRRLVVPGVEIYFWVVERTLSMNMYAYNDWERDKEWFLRTDKYHGREHGAIRYLPYRSRCDCEDLDGAIFEGIGPIIDWLKGAGELPPRNTLHSHRDDWRCPLMVHYDHYGTEYEPVGEEPWMYRTYDVLAVTRDWLTNYLLPTL